MAPVVVKRGKTPPISRKNVADCCCWALIMVTKRLTIKNHVLIDKGEFFIHWCCFSGLVYEGLLLKIFDYQKVQEVCKCDKLASYVSPNAQPPHHDTMVDKKVKISRTLSERTPGRVLWRMRSLGVCGLYLQLSSLISRNFFWEILNLVFINIDLWTTHIIILYKRRQQNMYKIVDWILTEVF